MYQCRADLGRPLNSEDRGKPAFRRGARCNYGFTMFENIEFDGGQITNASFADYKIPSILDIPRIMANEAVEAGPGLWSLRS